VSHSIGDGREAVALKQWLAEQRPELANEIFLDIDAQSGFRLGPQWKGQILARNPHERQTALALPKPSET
jgi:hypothetical protein